MFVGGLLVDGLRVVDARGDALRVEVRLEGVALDTVAGDGVLVEDVSPARRRVRRRDRRVFEVLRERGGVGLSRASELGETFELDPADGRGDARHAEVVADLGVFVAGDAAVVHEPGGALGDVGAVCRNHAALARGHVLRRVEREARGVAEGADASSLDCRAVSLRGVLDEQEVVLRCELREPRHVRREAVEVDCDDCVHPLAGPEPRFERVGVDVVRSRVDVDETHFSAREGDGVGRGDEREGRRQDAVAGADAERVERGVERRRPVGGGDAVVGFAVVGELPFEAPDLGAVGYHAAFEDGRDSVPFRRAELGRGD